MLAGVGDREIGFLGEGFDATFALGEQFEAVAVAEGLADAGEVIVEAGFELALCRRVCIQKTN